MWVLLERNSRRGLAPFGALVYEAANNIYVHPDDTIYLYREPQTYLAFGALGSQQQIPFGAWRITLAEAVGVAIARQMFQEILRLIAKLRPQPPPALA
jgi:polysaccharide export outer membrane protein